MAARGKITAIQRNLAHDGCQGGSPWWATPPPRHRTLNCSCPSRQAAPAARSEGLALRSRYRRAVPGQLRGRAALVLMLQCSAIAQTEFVIMLDVE